VPIKVAEDRYAVLL